MPYLSSDDITAMGLSVTPAQVVSASAIIDSYLQRPEGLLWVPDGSGAPCYMAGLTAAYTLALTAPLAPGVNVNATVSGYVPADLAGQVLVADAANAEQTEALIVTVVAGQTLTFAQVQFSHAGGAALGFGQVITEERKLPAKRPVTQATRTPLVRLVAGQGRYGYGRRSQQSLGLSDELSLLATLQQFGPALWQSFNAMDASVSPGTGEVWIPAGVYLANYTDVRLHYVAGYQAVPQAIKTACGNIATALAAFPEMSGGIQKLQAGGTLIERFANSGIDADTQQLLTPYKARAFY